MKGPGRNGAGRLRPVTVLADDFDDGGETDTRGDPIRRPPTAASAGGAGRGGSPGPAGIVSSAETSTNRVASGKRVETTIKGTSAQERRQSDSRSTRREKAAKPPAGTAADHSGGKHIPSPAGTGDASSTQITSVRKQRGSNTARQEQATAQAEGQALAPSGGAPLRPGRKPPVKRVLPRKAEALSHLPARQGAGAAPIRKAPAVPGIEAPARPGRNTPERRKASSRRAALLPSAPARQELAAVLPRRRLRRKNAVPVRLGRNRVRVPRPPRVC